MILRLSFGKVYHIYNRGINRKKIFFEDRNYDFFLQRFRRYVLGHIGLLTYCLMPNHFHLLVRINEFEFKEDVLLTGVEKAFKNFFISIQNQSIRLIIVLGHYSSINLNERK